MSFYLSNTTAQPTGLEPGEFLDIPSMAEAKTWAVDHDGRAASPTATGGAATRTYVGNGITTPGSGSAPKASARSAPSIHDLPPISQLSVQEVLSMGFRPYFGSGDPPTTDHHDGFLRVRVSDDVKPLGYVVVYLASGTAITVATDQVLSFDLGDRSPVDDADKIADP